MIHSFFFSLFPLLSSFWTEVLPLNPCFLSWPLSFSPVHAATFHQSLDLLCKFYCVSIEKVLHFEFQTCLLARVQGYSQVAVLYGEEGIPDAWKPFFFQSTMWQVLHLWSRPASLMVVSLGQVLQWKPASAGIWGVLLPSGTWNWEHKLPLQLLLALPPDCASVGFQMNKCDRAS